MPKRKQRMAGYIRESDPSLADSITIESQAKVVHQYADKEGYMYDTAVHEYKEAISAYLVPYMERPVLLKLLDAAKRREFDVLVVSEVRSISRRQVEVFIVYDILQKFGIRLETVKEKFEDDAMGRLILGLRAAYAEIEREQSFVRMQRGKKDRIEISGAPNGHPYPMYGYSLIDTEREVKAVYVFNTTVIYIDNEGRDWTPKSVRLFLFEKAQEQISVRGIAKMLNDIGVPPPRKARTCSPHWNHQTVNRLLRDRMAIGEVWANRYRKVGKTIIERPKEEWVRLPDCPSLIDTETFEKIQEQLMKNKEDSLRNNRHPDALALLRGAHIFCGVCGQQLHVVYSDKEARRRETHRYRCQRKVTNHDRVTLNHRTQIHVPALDADVVTHIIEIVKNPIFIRARVEELRTQTKPVVDAEDIQTTIDTIRRAMQNLYNMAEHATDDETMVHITERMNNLEKQKRDAEALLYDLEDEEEELAEIEAEIVKFETWAEKVRPHLSNPSYTPTYEELRLAVRILGIRVTVYPTTGEWPYRYKIDVTVPAILAKLHCVANNPTFETLP